LPACCSGGNDEKNRGLRFRQGLQFSAIARAIARGAIKAELALLVCDNPRAPVIERARRAKTAVLLVPRDDFPSKEAFEETIIRGLRQAKIDLVVLAGFMRIIGPKLISAYPNRIINIHPALLPSFKGAHAIEDAFAYGVKTTGVTVHFVDEKTDHGPIILQAPVQVRENEDAGSLEARIHKAEHKIYPEAIGLFLEGRLKVTGRKVLVTSP
jgi:phosphoribosylglycinamide formyltransferase 1